MGSQELSVSWKDHSSVLVAVFEKLLSNKSLVDCTVAAEGQYLKVHKVVLSACSPYFEVLLNEDSDKHPIIILRDVKFEDLRRIIDFVYRGEVKLPEDQLVEFLNVAESLQIKGLGAGSNETSGKRIFTEELLTKKKSDSPIPSKRTRNQLSSSEEKSQEPVPCSDVSNIDNSDSQWQKTSSSINTHNSSTVGSAVTSNLFTKNAGSTNSQKDFTISDASGSSTSQLPLDQLNISSRTVVKVELNNDDSLEPKDEYGYQAIANEFPEDSYILDAGSQSAQPSTSHQYSQLTSSHMSSGSLVAVNSLTGSQVTESGHSEGVDLLAVRVAQTAPRARSIVLRVAGASAHTAPAPRSRVKTFVAVHCRKCDKLVRKEVWETHCARHGAVRCGVCGKMFSGASQLRIHTRIHTGERPFKCDTCDRAFTQAATLRRHKIIHTDERPFLCELCGQKFRMKWHLQFHERAHIARSCAVCGLMFKQPKQLLAHNRKFHAGAEAAEPLARSEAEVDAEEDAEAIDSAADDV